MRGNGSVELDRAACLEHLRSRSIGRIAFTDRALPVIAPIAYRLIDEHLVFGTTRGTPLDHGLGPPGVVAVAVDNVDEPDGGRGGDPVWTILVTGQPEELGHPLDAGTAALFDVGSPGSAGQRRFVQLSTGVMSGLIQP